MKMNILVYPLGFLLCPLVFVVSHIDHSGKDAKLSDQQHFEGGEHVHNVQYDHDAFLGKGHGSDFDDLTPEESKRRLGIIVGRIDINADGHVDNPELLRWIEHQRTRYMWDTIDDIINASDQNKDGKLNWKEFKEAHYGIWQDESKMERRLRRRLAKDERKFTLTDSNKDGYLVKEEYVYFRHPEESEEEDVRQIAVDEVLEEIDKNEDGSIDIEEFMGQYHLENESDDPPDWVLNDRKHFMEELDKNKSGKLERQEIYLWVVPSIEESKKETAHLIDGADDNGDGKLSRNEILIHYELFVGSTATDHGKTLKNHDEF